ncbi:MAG: TolC family protein [Acidobacteria bacterium]|nr:TolC family protein [Acidobacteriota bacterium]
MKPQLIVAFGAMALASATSGFAQVAAGDASSARIGMLFASGQTARAPLSTLTSLVEELDRNNPELKAARREIDMRVARVAPAGAPPDPSLRVGYMGGMLRLPFFPSASAPGSFRQFGLSQEIPYPGKLGLQRRVAATEVDAERWNAEDTRTRLIAELKMAYVEYVYINRSLGVIQRSKERLEQFRQIAEAQFRVGQGLQQDVLKAQVEISMILEREAVFTQERDTLSARINGLLFRPPDAPLDSALAYDASTVIPSVGELRTLVQQNYPALKRDERVIDRGQQALSLARREVLPDFAVNVTSQKFTGDMPWMYGVDVMVTLPVFWQRRQRPMIAEAAAALDSSRRMRDNTLSTAVAQTTREYLAATTSRRLADLYSDSTLPQARLALESSLASYQVGRLDFLSVLTNFLTVLTYELNYEEQTARAGQALARLESLTGLTLVR